MSGAEVVGRETRLLRVFATLSMVTGVLALGILGLMRALTVMLALPQYNPPYYPVGANEWARMMPLILWGLGAAGVVVGAGAFRARTWALPAMLCWLALTLTIVFSPAPWGSGESHMWPSGFAAPFVPHVVCVFLLIRSVKSLK